MYKVVVYAPAERADTLPLFLLYLCMCSVVETSTGLSLQVAMASRQAKVHFCRLRQDAHCTDRPDQYHVKTKWGLNLSYKEQTTKLLHSAHLENALR
jgi:hypothetical protein